MNENYIFGFPMVHRMSLCICFSWSLSVTTLKLFKTDREAAMHSEHKQSQSAMCKHDIKERENGLRGACLYNICKGRR